MGFVGFQVGGTLGLGMSVDQTVDLPGFDEEVGCAACRAEGKMLVSWPWKEDHSMTPNSLSGHGPAMLSSRSFSPPVSDHRSGACPGDHVFLTATPQTLLKPSSVGQLSKLRLIRDQEGPVVSKMRGFCLGIMKCFLVPSLHTPA